jgi:hypothetical protein
LANRERLEQGEAEMRMWATWLVALALAVSGARAEEAVQRLRLVPFPKEVTMGEGSFDVGQRLILAAPRDMPFSVMRCVMDALKRAGIAQLGVQVSADKQSVRLAPDPSKAPEPPPFPEGADEAHYTLAVSPEGISLAGKGARGLLYAVQTLRQLLRANCRDGKLPCLTVRDWPSLRWRCFQDDLTRGPSTRLPVLKRQLELGAFLKMNLFTYYMEYQYAWTKHPVLGPEDGSLTPEELHALVAHGRPLHVDILGNQQSFGHFAHILKHDRYKPLRETGGILCPVKDESYQLLDDLYSEVIPHLPFPWFNVCCDETHGLGTGPSKELAERIGVGGVYARHLRRIHDLLKDKYGKRMMMWGDIILRHRDHLDEIPKDTILLTWGYGARDSFEHQIVPFAQSGYDFLVCPGVNNWSRMLPDFGVATTNIRNFVRDGARHGALGMLNTAWDDDGENFNAPSWHGYAWGAECAWNASATSPGDFNRRIGAVLFGEPGHHFGQAIELLAKTHRLPGMRGMSNRRFWQLDLDALKGNIRSARAQAQRLLEIVRPAIEHLEACQKQAAANADLLDYFLFGARRMELIGRRVLDTLAAGEAYRAAYEGPPADAAAQVAKAAGLIRQLRQAHQQCGERFAELWHRESKSYALDWTMRRYARAVSRYDALLKKLSAARAAAEDGKPLPAPTDVGLAMIELGVRRTRPHKVVREPLGPHATWTVPQGTHRIGLVVDAGPAARTDLPIELLVHLPEKLVQKPLRAVRVLDDGGTQELHAQLDVLEKPGQGRLVVLLPGPLPKGEQAAVLVYLGLPGKPEPLPGAVSTRSGAKGTRWLENDKVRLLLAPEGGHIYRWEVKALGKRDLTVPGETSWFGFADLGGRRRSAKNELRCTARGPAMVRYVCTDAAGTEKTVSLFAGACWAEVTLNEGVTYFWALDNPKNFAADGPTPGRYRFSTGAEGPVGKDADAVAAQVKATRALWCVKFVPDTLALGLATPGQPARHVIGPGGGAGGVGIEGRPAASHFITYGGTLNTNPGERMNQLATTLDLRRQPTVTLHAVQVRPKPR